MKKVFESPREAVSLTSSLKLRQLLLMSLEASQKILTILENLQEQGLLGDKPLLQALEFAKGVYRNLSSMGPGLFVRVYNQPYCRSFRRSDSVG
jgi:hypothetical protein